MKKVAIICSLALVSFLALSFFTPQSAIAKPVESAMKSCAADLNGDGCVSTADLLIFLTCWDCFQQNGGSIASCPKCAAADFDGNHNINWWDYQFMLNAMNGPCAC